MPRRVQQGELAQRPGSSGGVATPSCYTLESDRPPGDGAPLLLRALRSAFPWLRHVFADSAYAGGKLQGALAKLGEWTIEIVKRSDAARGFVVLPRRWVVERTLAWLNRNRRLSKDFEVTIESATTWL